ncbi:hypothetical protein P154DRAFT_529891 [Amniculicola lignicola CBS 123094]|uniref:Uncharacterized protein n=1 Tax=Amniculicola lignicola CBS 123094 TaxID=1392246 RepID=A0A6A5X2Q9_9PLEO|nr:hypothetical protein P154DRAFT_529891 [Amniculicola lignicola CBS 123094]
MAKNTDSNNTKGRNHGRGRAPRSESPPPRPIVTYQQGTSVRVLDPVYSTGYYLVSSKTTSEAKPSAKPTNYSPHASNANTGTASAATTAPRNTRNTPTAAHIPASLIANTRNPSTTKIPTTRTGPKPPTSQRTERPHVLTTPAAGPGGPTPSIPVTYQSTALREPRPYTFSNPPRFMTANWRQGRDAKEKLESDGFANLREQTTSPTLERVRKLREEEMEKYMEVGEKEILEKWEREMKERMGMDEEFRKEMEDEFRREIEGSVRKEVAEEVRKERVEREMEEKFRKERWERGMREKEWKERVEGREKVEKERSEEGLIASGKSKKTALKPTYADVLQAATSTSPSATPTPTAPNPSSIPLPPTPPKKTLVLKQTLPKDTEDTPSPEPSPQSPPSHTSLSDEEYEIIDDEAIDEDYQTVDAGGESMENGDGIKRWFGLWRR